MKVELDITTVDDAEPRGEAPTARKVWVQGSRPDLRVPMREIRLSPTPSGYGSEENPPVLLYDTGGPYTDWGAEAGVRPDVRQGLPALGQKRELAVLRGIAHQDSAQ